MAKISKLAGLLRGGKLVKANTRVLKDLLFHEKGIASRKAIRKGLKGDIVKSVKGGKNAPKFGKAISDYAGTSAKQLEGYFTKGVRDVFHPKKTMENIWASTKYYYDPAKNSLAKRSIAGNLFSKGIYLGLPATYGAGEYKARRKGGQGVLRSAGAGVLQTAPWLATKRYGSRWLASIPIERGSLRQKQIREKELLAKQREDII